MATKETNAPATGLDAIADEAENLGRVEVKPAPMTPEEIQANQAMEKIEKGFVTVLVGLLKVGRAFVARRLPEIEQEWTNDALEEPAAAALPLAKKHLAGLMTIVGSSPELAAFVFACMPLGMGLISAMEKADQRRAREALAPPAEPTPGLVGAPGG